MGLYFKSIEKLGSFGNGMGARNCLRHFDRCLDETEIFLRAVVLQVRHVILLRTVVLQTLVLGRIWIILDYGADWNND